MGIALSDAVNDRSQAQADNLRLYMGLTETVATSKGTGMKTAIIYILISVLASIVGQLLLKVGMNSMGSITLSSSQFLFTVWKMVTNPYVFIGLAIYFAGTVFWLAALSRVDLSYAYPFASLSYVAMLVASWMVFDEKITLSRLLGTVVICIGVILIYRN